MFVPNIGIDGKDYAKYGTTFDNQLVIIDKTGKSDDNIVTGKVDSVEDLLPLVEGIRNDRKQPESSESAKSEQAEQAVGKAPSEKVGQNPEPGMASQPAISNSGQWRRGKVDLLQPGLQESLEECLYQWSPKKAMDFLTNNREDNPLGQKVDKNNPVEVAALILNQLDSRLSAEMEGYPGTPLPNSLK